MIAIACLQPLLYVAFAAGRRVAEEVGGGDERKRQRTNNEGQRSNVVSGTAFCNEMHLTCQNTRACSALNRHRRWARHSLLHLQQKQCKQTFG